MVALLALILAASCVREQPKVDPDEGEADASSNPVSDIDVNAAPVAVDSGPALPSGNEPAPPCAVLDVATSTDAADAGGRADAASKPVDVQPVSCSPGESHCVGMQLATCTPAGDGWHQSYCFPGSHCSDGICTPIANNLIIIFDTSGSMGTPVPGLNCTSNFVWPKCEMSDKPCTRMGMSKHVFGKALAKLKATATRLALFRFPQITSANVATCANGFYEGASRIAGDGSEESILESTSWYWKGLDQVLCVDFPAKPTDDSKEAIAKWMDGVEIKGSNPELRTTGGTPIGNTLFYVGEYLRHRVIVDGRKCAADADCGNANYSCQGGKCVDPARSCRETAVVLYTDGGEVNVPGKFRSPWVQAKRLAFGLGCVHSDDCVGGADCYKGHCRPPKGPCNICYPTGEDCDPTESDKASSLYCPSVAALPPDMPSCRPDPISAQIATSAVAGGNVLRSPDGKPFGVRLHVVDISGSGNHVDSFSLAAAGNGQMLAADAADPDKFLATLDKALDLKNQKVCGVTY